MIRDLVRLLAQERHQNPAVYRATLENMRREVMQSVRTYNDPLDRVILNTIEDLLEIR